MPFASKTGRGMILKSAASLLSDRTPAWRSKPTGEPRASDLRCSEAKRSSAVIVATTGTELETQTDNKTWQHKARGAPHSVHSQWTRAGGHSQSTPRSKRQDARGREQSLRGLLDSGCSKTIILKKSTSSQDQVYPVSPGQAWLDNVFKLLG